MGLFVTPSFAPLKLKTALSLAYLYSLRFCFPSRRFSKVVSNSVLSR